MSCITPAIAGSETTSDTSLSTIADLPNELLEFIFEEFVAVLPRRGKKMSLPVRLVCSRFRAVFNERLLLNYFNVRPTDETSLDKMISTLGARVGYKVGSYREETVWLTDGYSISCQHFLDWS